MAPPLPSTQVLSLVVLFATDTESHLCKEREKRRREKREKERREERREREKGESTDGSWLVIFRPMIFRHYNGTKVICIIHYMRYSTLSYKIVFEIWLAHLALLGNFRVLCRTHVHSYPTLKGASRVNYGSWLALGDVNSPAQPTWHLGGQPLPPQRTYIHTYAHTSTDIHTSTYIHKIGFVLDDFAHCRLM